jgi:thioredoxin-related protein
MTRNSFIKIWLGIMVLSLPLFAQSFYVLTNIKQYDPKVVNMSSKVDKGFEGELKEMLVSTSKELGIDISQRTSRVLIVLLQDISVGPTVGLSIELSLGEYVRRKDESDAVFAITYQEMKFVERVKDKDEFEESIADSVEEMLDRFTRNYQEDNKKISQTKKSVKHAHFATEMKYETDYNIARKKAKEAKKPLMIFMTTNFCPWCRKLENRVLSKADINAKIHDKYIPVMLNFDEKQFPKVLHENRLTPTLYIMNPEKEKILEEFIGYSAKDAFLHTLKEK